MAFLGVVLQVAQRDHHGRHAASQTGTGQLMGEMIDFLDVARGYGLAQT